MGIEQGDIDVLPLSRYFGMANYASIYGSLYAFFALGAGLAPVIFGRVFDAQGNYDSILMVAAVMFVIGALPLLFLGKYRNFDAPEEDAAS